MAKECFYFDNTQIIEPVQVGVDWLFNRAKVKKDCWLAVNAIENLHIIAEKYPGLSELKKLDNEFFKCNINGINTRLILANKIPSSGKDLPLLAIHPDKEYLTDLDNITNIDTMMVIPWVPHEIEDWITQRKAKLYQLEETFESFDEEYYNNMDQVIKNALYGMDNNLSTTRDSVKEIFFILISSGYDLDPNKIRQILIKKYNWKKADAAIAFASMEKVRNGEISYRFTENMQDKLNKWKQ